MIQRQKHANCAASCRAKGIHAKVHSNGMKSHTTYLTCIQNRVHHVMTTMGKPSSVTYIRLLNHRERQRETQIFYFSNYRYCDVFQKCREVDPAGPLATLRRLLLSEESIESFKKWVLSNWFIVSLIISGIISLLVRNSFVFCFQANFKFPCSLLTIYQNKHQLIHTHRY